MLNSIAKSCAAAALVCCLTVSISPSADAKRLIPDDQSARHVDLAIALDVSSSMSGLIDSTKQRLWDIVNELGRAQPQPILRVAIISYGSPNYGNGTGYVRIDQHFTTDLDVVNQKLFAFTTGGGDEYVARAVDSSTRALDWSSDSNALRIIFVAGNESAEQDPMITVEQATRTALNKGIVVNTLYCGTDGDGVSPGWRKVANLTQGLYASIDQNAAAVANIPTPMDAELARLNDELNTTYVAYGAKGESYRRNQVDQDRNAGLMSRSAKASRAVTKAGAMYNSSHWDLVDAVESGQPLEEFEVNDLPEEMREMENEERAEYLQAKQDERVKIQGRIAQLDRDRRAFIEEKKKEQSEGQGKGLDEAIQDGIRKVAAEKGFTFTE